MRGAVFDRPRFVPNLSMLWTEVDMYERFGCARDAGFTRAEMHFPQALRLDRLKAAITRSGVRLVLFDIEAGSGPGELGLLCLAGRDDEFRSTLRRAIELAQTLDVRFVNLLAGIRPNTLSLEEAWASAVGNLRSAGVAAAAAGVTLLIEAINSRDRPDYLVPTVAAAADLIAAAGHTNVRLQLDTYHVARQGDDLVGVFDRYRDLVDYVQLADYPGRHQPGTGELPLVDFLRRLRRHQYGGFIGLEYEPLGSTTESLTWLPQADRA